jgi:hypothetical protein
MAFLFCALCIQSVASVRRIQFCLFSRLDASPTAFGEARFRPQKRLMPTTVTTSDEVQVVFRFSL